MERVTASEIARQFGATVTAVSIAPLPLERAGVNATSAGLWRQPPTAEAREVFLGQVCPGLQFDTLDDWTRISAGAGLTGLETVTGKAVPYLGYVLVVGNKPDRGSM